MVIYKYPFPITDHFALPMPEGAEILCVQMQRDTPCLWAKVDMDQPIVNRGFFIHGTGMPIGDQLEKYIGTLQQLDGALIWHVFEEV